MAYWLTEAWYCALYSNLLVEGGLQARTLLGQPMVLWRDTQGVIHAMEDRCPHRYAPLSLGKQVGDNIRCGYHGLEFDGSGMCVEIRTAVGRFLDPRRCEPIPLANVAGSPGSGWVVASRPLRRSPTYPSLRKAHLISLGNRAGCRLMSPSIS